jgi:hypothetical protein
MASASLYGVLEAEPPAGSRGKDGYRGRWGAAAPPTSTSFYIGIPLTVPRCASRQTARSNMPSDSLSTYYRRAVWCPYLDAIVMSFREKFSKRQLTLLHLVALVASTIDTLTLLIATLHTVQN